MQIREVMVAPVCTLSATATIAEAAALMAARDIGAIPVLQGDELIGIVTDRDIATRGMAVELDPVSPVMRVTTRDVVTCSPICSVDDVLDTMVTHGVRRMPIRSVDGRLLGIVSLSDLARVHWDKDRVGQAFADTCGTRHLQPLKKPAPEAALTTRMLAAALEPDKHPTMGSRETRE